MIWSSKFLFIFIFYFILFYLQDSPKARCGAYRGSLCGITEISKKKRYKGEKRENGERLKKSKNW